ncbi:fidgetin-like protein 1 [Haematobia irritans]|uniref:fidgetin-like protein 1 n=1 Tax=Haematobia irritans TaxID=7368 RepID=UPI003F5068E9
MINEQCQLTMNKRQHTILASEFVDNKLHMMEHLMMDNVQIKDIVLLQVSQSIKTQTGGPPKIRYPDIENFTGDGKNEYENMFATSINMEDETTHVKQNRDTPRNTMDKFLNRQTTNRDPNGFFTAREMLSTKNMKNNAHDPSSQRKSDTYMSNQTADFSFTATKKKLGALGRISNNGKKNFVPPVRGQMSSTKEMPSEETTEMGMEPSHPALKNIDPKMVEVINNEIMRQFKPVDWSEIAGLNYAKSIIKEAVVYPLLRPDIFTGLRRPPRGILLFGPPGTGKTLIGKCIASQSNSTFFSISSASLTSKWMGEGEKMVRTLFAVAVARQPSVIFMDEIDSLLSKRSENENEGTRRLKTEFLVRLDGASTSDDDRVLIVGATNRPQELDDAVRRRFVKRLYVPLPELDARVEILKNLLQTVDNNLETSDLAEIAKLAEGYSGADMDSLCREASMEPLREQSNGCILTVTMKSIRAVNRNDFHIALKKIRPSVSQNDLDQYVEWNKTYGSNC